VSSKGTNCVNYVAYRLSRNGVAQQSAMGNGGSWASNARKRGFRVDLTPKVGSIAQWNYGSAYAPSYGHVGYVEEVTSSYIVISDNSYSGGYSSRWRVPKGDRNWPSNFIHFKDMAYQPPASGSFLRVRENGEVYRLIGKAPVYVSTWTAFGGTKPTHPVSSATLAALPARPTNGTFIKGAQRREVYRVVGGAPVYVSTWAAYGGKAQPAITVDQVAIDRAGTGDRWNHLLARPATGTVIKGAQRAEVYVVVGGAPVAVHSWANIGGYRAQTTVDQVAVDKAGSATRYNHLGFLPTDGTILQTLEGKRYRVSGGVAAPTTLTTGGTVTDRVAIANAGTGTTARWRHLARATS
jgi:hypothetical protein